MAETVARQLDVDSRQPRLSLCCIECGQHYPAQEQRYKCDCGGLLDVEHDLERLRSVVTRELFDARLGALRLPYSSGVWRFAELVFPGAAERAVSGPEGNTNLYSSDRLARWAGLDSLLLKHEGENPTGSFKDRGMTVGVTHAVGVGATVVACASTGNTSASMASYAARGGLRAVVFIPHGAVALGKLSQSIAYGALTVQIRGDFDAAMRLVTELTRDQGIYLLNSLNPFRLEGQKTIVLECLQQMSWDPPDWIVLPGGNLGNTSAFGKALYEARELGLISRLPRLAVIQAAGANPLYRAFRSGYLEYRPVEAKTIATAIKIGDPVSYRKARRALEWTDGVVEEVQDSEIMDAKAQIDAAGIGCEPASAASLAGLRKLVEGGTIKRGATVVAVLTGHLLKDPDNTIGYHLGTSDAAPGAYANGPVVIEPRLEEVLKVL